MNIAGKYIDLFRILYTWDMLDLKNSDPDFINTIITGMESWVYGYDPEPVIFLTMKMRREY